MGLAYFDEIYKTSSDLQKTIIETVHRLIHPSNVDLGTEKIPTVYNPRQKSCSSITTIGGMILLGLAFFDTKNKSAVQILEFDKELGDMSVRPDFATFLILSKSLINWSLVEATQEWIDDQIPKIIKSQAFKPHDINSPNGMNRFYIK
ncbi:MAG: Anaphase-promoting complex subunit 1 [Marteilia pararefringens]